MRQLFPVGGEVDPAVAHAAAARPRPTDRPWVLVNMVASVDGATALDGVSGGLGGAGDKEVFSAIRAVADVILVAGGTARAESYGPPRTPSLRRAERTSRGQAPYPRLAVVTGSLDLDPQSPLFTEAPEPPLVYTVPDSPPERREALSAVAEVVDAGDDRVDLALVLHDLAGRGASIVLAEGGPSLNGQLLADGLVDELNLSWSPTLVGGPSPRVLASSDATPLPVGLRHLWEDDGFLFARYTAASEPPAGGAD